MSYYLSLAVDILVTVASVLVLILILNQLRQQNKQTQFEALNEAQRRISAPEFRQAMDHVLTILAHANTGSGLDELQEEIALVVGAYGQLGLRVREGVLPHDATLEAVWQAMALLRDRILGSTLPRYQFEALPFSADFDWLAAEAQAYQRDNHPDSRPNAVVRG